MNHQLEPVDLLSSFIEYRAEFKEPVLEAWNKGEFNTAVFRAFRPWNIGLTDFTWNSNPANAGEVQSRFELLKGRYIFIVECGATGLSVVNPNWSEAVQIGQIAQAGNTAVLSMTKAEITRQIVQMNLQLKSRHRNLAELTSSFLNPSLHAISEEPIRASGFSLYADNRVWIVDLSASHRDALYLRMTRTFAPETTLEQIAETLATDQASFLESLKLMIIEEGD